MAKVIPDSGVFAVMPRVTIFGARDVRRRSARRRTDAGLRAPPPREAVHRAVLEQRLPDVQTEDSFTALVPPDGIAPADDIVAKNATILNPDREVMSSTPITLSISEEVCTGRRTFSRSCKRCPRRWSGGRTHRRERTIARKDLTGENIHPKETQALMKA
jgi:CBS domain-containing protein